jgi:hypothetical protein
MYRRVHKGKHVIGIGMQVQRERLIHILQEKNKQHNSEVETPLTVPFEEPEALPYTSPELHHHMSYDTRHKVNLTEWLGKNIQDPAIFVGSLSMAMLPECLYFYRTFSPILKTTSYHGS